MSLKIVILRKVDLEVGRYLSWMTSVARMTSVPGGRGFESQVQQKNIKASLSNNWDSTIVISTNMIAKNYLILREACSLSLLIFLLVKVTIFMKTTRLLLPTRSCEKSRKRQSNGIEFLGDTPTFFSLWISALTYVFSIDLITGDNTRKDTWHAGSCMGNIPNP